MSEEATIKDVAEESTTERKKRAPKQETVTVAFPPDLSVPLGEPVEHWRAREIAKIKDAARQSRLDTTVPGGRYFENGRWVDASGNPLDE